MNVLNIMLSPLLNSIFRLSLPHITQRGNTPLVEISFCLKFMGYKRRNFIILTNRFPERAINAL